MIPHLLQTSSIILIAALGGLVAERAGVLNIGLEGLISVGAFAAFVAVRAGTGPFPALLAAAAAGIAVAAILAVFGLRLGANIFVAGLAVNLLSTGLLSLLSETLFATRGVVRLAADVPLLSQVTPVAIAAAVTGITYLLLAHTPTGVRVRVAGQEAEWLRVQGVDVVRVRTAAVLYSGAAAGVAGALLALRLGAYLPGISSGRGWIALVVIYLGYRNVFGLAGAALLFGVLDAVAVRAQAVIDAPPTVLLALPYVLTVIVFVSYSAFRARESRSRVPR